MKTLPEKCAGIDTVESFCGCISDEEHVDPAAKAFCNRAKTDKNITNEDLSELKMTLMDREEDDACCEC